MGHILVIKEGKSGVRAVLIGLRETCVELVLCSHGEACGIPFQVGVPTNRKCDIVDMVFHASCIFGLAPTLGLPFSPLWGMSGRHTTVHHCV